MNKKYTILIICEGEKTEPLFFNSIRNKLINDSIGNDMQMLFELTIAPEPIIDIKDSSKTIKHKKNRKKRVTKVIPSIDNIKIIDGKPPLRWVETAIREFETGAFNEVWTVFDNDNHPSKKDAFERAKKNNINIAYSSRSFEQYLLTNFVRKYITFQKTDCKHKKNNKSYSNRCGTGIYSNKDCRGKVCINGYACVNGYWDNSNDENSKKINTFSLISDKLEIGYENSSWLRYKSDLKQANTPIYNRTAYTNVDKLVKKLLSYNKIHKWIQLDKSYIFGKIDIFVKHNNEVIIKNISTITIIIPNQILSIFYLNTTQFEGQRKILAPNEEIIINISNYSSGTWFKINFEEYIIMFET